MTIEDETIVVSLRDIPPETRALRACKDKTNVFFPDTSLENRAYRRAAAEALRLCDRCIVKPECAVYTAKTIESGEGPIHGIWAGLDFTPGKSNESRR